ncbi:ATP-binding protein [Streptomyces jumonjinensis]|uniref:ATP-binding protein n=1 Tax=Streptomyces jumonjinensis TaxID=1945 RepID=UPI0037B9C9B9
MNGQTSLTPVALEFSMRFTSSPRGARLARRLVSQRLDSWGHPYSSSANEALTLIAAELTSNAVRHGHVPGRDFHLRLTWEAGTLRIEVSDSRTDRVPLFSGEEPPDDAESGRGLLLVARLADRWAISPRVGAPGKTAWAELSVPCMEGCRPGGSSPGRAAMTVTPRDHRVP